MMKKAFGLIFLLLIGIADAALYWNMHLYYAAKDTAEDPAKKIGLLERANRYFPWNDLVYLELGRAYFDQGSNDLGNAPRRDADIRASFDSFMRSLRLNPGSLAAHFHLAQTLLFQSYFSKTLPLSYFEEYKKAASLTGHNSQIFFEVGKILLSRWPSLTAEEKDFTAEILGRLMTGKSREKLLSILQVWEMNGRDYGLMQKILPDDSGILRTYAQFLGERALSLEERQRSLARAEYLEFVLAKQGMEEGERALQNFQLQEAEDVLGRSLEALKKIRFYQTLTRQNLIRQEDFAALIKTAHLNLAKCKIEMTGTLEEAESDILSYLGLENQLSAVAEFETFLRERGHIGGESGSVPRDLRQLVVQMSLDFKQNRYREIIRIGSLLTQSFFVVPGKMKAHYLNALQLVGDSYQKLDYVYESEAFFQNALRVEPNSLSTLFKIRKSYERLNDEEKLRATNVSINALLSPPSLSLNQRVLQKGEEHSLPLLLTGGRVRVNLSCRGEGTVSALVSLAFNGRVVWEDFVKDNFCHFSADSAQGQNLLTVVPLAGLLVLEGLNIQAEAPETPRSPER